MFLTTATDYTTPETSEPHTCVPSTKLTSVSTVDRHCESPAHHPAVVTSSRPQRDRKANQRNDFTYDDDDVSYQEFNRRGKSKKKKLLGKRTYRDSMDEDDGDTERLVPKGVSVFDLIMPWKTQVENQESKDLVNKGLAKVVNCS